MNFEYQLNKHCEVLGAVTITMLVTANNGGGCQIDTFEKPVDCNRKEECPGGSKCLLKEINMSDYFE